VMTMYHTKCCGATKERTTPRPLGSTSHKDEGIQTPDNTSYSPVG
jgi:hypothetical protein